MISLSRAHDLDKNNQSDVTPSSKKLFSRRNIFFNSANMFMRKRLGAGALAAGAMIAHSQFASQESAKFNNRVLGRTPEGKPGTLQHEID